MDEPPVSPRTNAPSNVPPDPQPNPSLKDEPCPGPGGKAYNEAKARTEFGDDLVDKLITGQPDFCGDWWQLALLTKRVDESDEAPHAPPEERLRHWNEWTSGSEIIHLERAELQNARLEHADLEGAHLEHAYLRESHLEHANLRESHLEHANFFRANLRHADLRRAHLEDATLLEADLSSAELRDARGLRFDDNPIRDIRIEGNARDPWSVLRRSYTGPWFFAHLLLLLLFFAPYAGKAVALTGVAEAYALVSELIPALEGEPISVSFRLTRAFYVLIGIEQGWLAFVFALVVVGYNGLRAVLTLRGSMLRDAEERSVVSPRLAEYHGYCSQIRERFFTAEGRDELKAEWENGRPSGPIGWIQEACTALGLWNLHRAARGLFVFAFAALVINTFWWIRDTWVPILH